MLCLSYPAVDPSSRYLTTVQLLVLALIAVFVTGSAAVAQNTAAHPQDANPVTLKNIEDNYGKRYHFAATARLKDQVVNGQSERGSSASYQAYKLVRRKCTDGLGTMDDKPCDTDGVPLFCAEECLPDACPPTGKHCPVSPHFNWAQDQNRAEITPPSARDAEALDTGLLTTFGLPMSDTLYQLIDRENKQRLLEHMFDPERWMWVKTNSSHMQTLALANSLGGAAESSFASAFKTIQQGPLVNVANEHAGAAGAQGGVEGAVYIVQRMYKELFLPMALLLLLPGAILTQVKGLVDHSILGTGEDSISPFTGIIRAVIAIFLIPSTQLIVSYCIDAGNVMAEEVAKPEKGWIQESTLSQWAKEQTFNPDPTHVNNGILVFGQSKDLSATTPPIADAGIPTGANNQIPSGQTATPGINIEIILGTPSGNPAIDAFKRILNFLFGRQFTQAINASQGAGEGKAVGQLEGQVINEDQLWLSSVMQVGFNGAAFAMASALNVLTAYQIVFMCYLFLLGPIAACFFAWPSGIGGLFKKVFSNWVDAVVVLSLWRFWWCVILAVMTQRIIFLQPNPGSPAEMMVYNCFLVLLLYIPFQPFNFNPGPMVSQVLDKAGAGGGGGGKGSGSSGSTGGSTGAAGDTGSAQNAGGVRRDASTDRSLTDIASVSKPQGAISPGSISPAVKAPPSANPTDSRSPQTPPGLPGGKTAGGKAPTVPGSAVPSVAPPVSSGKPNPALNVVRNEFSMTNIGSIMAGIAPIVALAPEAPIVLLNTVSSTLAMAGMKTLQQQAAVTPSYLKDGSVAVSTTGVATAGTGSGKRTTGSGSPPVAAAGTKAGAPGALPGVPGATNLSAPPKPDAGSGSKQPGKSSSEKLTDPISPSTTPPPIAPAAEGDSPQDLIPPPRQNPEKQ